MKKMMIIALLALGVSGVFAQSKGDTYEVVKGLYMLRNSNTYMEVGDYIGSTYSTHNGYTRFCCASFSDGKDKSCTRSSIIYYSLTDAMEQIEKFKNSESWSSYGDNVFVSEEQGIITTFYDIDEEGRIIMVKYPWSKR